MKISFIIPAYNEESAIAKCIESIQNELARGSYDGEIVVGNNASTDRTGEVARSFAGVRVVDEPQKGPNHARQAGLRIATGDLIANIDADSIVPPGWLKTVFADFERVPKLAGLSGPYIYYDLSPFSRGLAYAFQAIGSGMNSLEHFISGGGSMFLGGNCVMRRDALEKIGGYDTSIAFYGDDVDTALRLHTVGDVRFTLRLPMYSSGRRLAREGIVRTNLKYFANHVWKMLTGAAFSQEHTDIRTPVSR